MVSAVMKYDIETLEDVLTSPSLKVLNDYYQIAEKLTSNHFGNDRRLFNPIYLSNVCLADCEYCGFRVSNKDLERRTLNIQETITEANFLDDRGINNILLLAGDYRHDKYVEMLIANINAVRNEYKDKWIGIEVASLEINEYHALIDAGANAIFVYQETYNRDRYDKLHHKSLYKGDYDFRKNSQSRAIEGGFKDVGFGVLYGINDWISDTIEMAQHALEISSTYPHIKLNFSFPRLLESRGQTLNSRSEIVTEEQLKRCVMGIRLLFPEANLILTGRESLQFLYNNSKIASMIGFKGNTKVGGYVVNRNTPTSQYKMSDSIGFNDFHRVMNSKYNLK